MNRLNRPCALVRTARTSVHVIVPAVVNNTAQNGAEGNVFYSPANCHCSDVVCCRGSSFYNRIYLVQTRSCAEIHRVRHFHIQYHVVNKLKCYCYKSVAHC